MEVSNILAFPPPKAASPPMPARPAPYSRWVQVWVDQEVWDDFLRDALKLAAGGGAV